MAKPAGFFVVLKRLGPVPVNAAFDAVGTALGIGRMVVPSYSAVAYLLNPRGGVR